MASDIHPVPFVADGLRDAADGIALFKDDGLDVGLLQQFVCGGETGRAGADDDGGFLGVHTGGEFISC